MITIELDTEQARIIRDLICRDHRLIEIHAELDNAISNADEIAYDRQQEDLRDNGGPDDSAYRSSMIDAGRGHQVR